MVLYKFFSGFILWRLVLIYQLCTFFSHVNAQVKDTQVTTEYANNKAEVLYLVLDKTLYTPGEVLWFSSYLSNTIDRVHELIPDMLSVALLRQDSSGFSLVKSYLMQKGLCVGSLSLPDTITAGDYTLVAATNLLDARGRPLHIFYTDITIKSPFIPALHATFEIDKNSPSDSLFMQARIWSSDRDLPKGRGNTIEYRLSNGWKGKVDLDIIGRSRFRIPTAEIEKSDHVLYTMAKFNNKTKRFNVRIPTSLKSPVEITVSGASPYLIAGLLQRIVWQSRRNGEIPYPLDASLYENGQKLMDIKTDIDGIGNFSFVPNYGATYQIISEDPVYPTRYTLPEVKSGGTDMQLVRYAVDDTLRVKIVSNTIDSLNIGIRPIDEQRILTAHIVLSESREMRVAFPLSGLEKGIHEVALLKDNGDTLARQFFFNRYQSNPDVVIEMDKHIYRTRDSVDLHIAVLDAYGKPQHALLTVYCVHQSRIDSMRKGQLPSYYYWDHWSNDKGGGATQEELVRKLSMGPHYLNSHRPIAHTNVSKAIFNGKASIRDHTQKKYKGTLNLLFKKDSEITLGVTDSMGNFFSELQSLAVKENKRLSVFASSNSPHRKMNSKDFRIEIENQMLEPMKLLEQEFVQTRSYKEIPLVQSDTVRILRGQPTNQIEEVAVYARARDVRRDMLSGKNECGDYVCVYGILNCQNHPFGGVPPIKGNYYQINGVRQRYEGCEELGDEVAQLYIGMDFQGMSLGELSNDTGNTYLSTLLWKPYVYTAKDDSTHIRYYTSDLKGEYSVIIEGITESGEFVYAQKRLIVE